MGVVCPGLNRVRVGRLVGAGGCSLLRECATSPPRSLSAPHRQLEIGARNKNLGALAGIEQVQIAPKNEDLLEAFLVPSRNSVPNLFK